jgi:membrane protein required for colicin V production
MNSLDIVLIIIVAVSVIYSLFRGFVREVFSLLSIVLGFMAAIRLYQIPAGILLTWIDNSIVAHILSFILTFIAVSICISLIGRLVRKFVRFVEFQSADRLLGAVFGLLKGVFVVTVLILVLILFLPPAHPVLTQSQLSPHFITLGELSLSMVPDELKETVRKKKEDFSLYWRKLPEKQLHPGEDEENSGDALETSKTEKETRQS